MLRAVKEPRHWVMILLVLDLRMRVTEARRLHWETSTAFLPRIVKVLEALKDHFYIITTARTVA